MKKYSLIFLFAIAVAGCSKNIQSGVMIRIENTTSFTLDSVKLWYDTTNYNYGTILPGEITEYVSFKSMLSTPMAIADSANKKIFAGLVIPPNSYPPQYLANGKYKLQIFPDTTLLYLNNSRYIKN